MGARVIDCAEGGRLPLTLQGAREPIPIVYESPVPSAQLKSAVLLAGLAAPGETTVIETEASRDHTERMLKHFGAKIVSRPHGEHGRRITLAGPAGARAGAGAWCRPIRPRRRFPLVAALIVPGSDLVLEAVMTNPLRTGSIHHAARDGRQYRDAAKRAATAARRSPICACAPAR